MKLRLVLCILLLTAFSAADAKADAWNYADTLSPHEFGGLYYSDEMAFRHVNLVTGNDAVNAHIEALNQASDSPVILHYVDYSLGELTDLLDTLWDAFRKKYELRAGSVDVSANILEIITYAYTADSIKKLHEHYPSLDMYQLRKALRIDDRYIGEGGYLNEPFVNADTEIVNRIKKRLSEMGPESHGGYFEDEGYAEGSIRFFLYLTHEDDELISLAEAGDVVVVPVEHSLSSMFQLKHDFETHIGGEYGITEVAFDVCRNIVTVYTDEYRRETIEALNEAFPRIDMYEICKTGTLPMGSYDLNYFRDIL